MEMTPAALGVPQGLNPQQMGWLQLASQKNDLFAYLQKMELAIQATLTNLPTADKSNPEELFRVLSIVQAKIKEAKQQNGELTGARKSFTGMLTDRLITPAMDFEKRVAELIATATAHELKLRKDAEAISQEKADRDKEEAQFKAHCINEVYRVGAEYRMNLARVVTDFYAKCLRQQIPFAEIPFQELRSALSFVQVPQMARFQLRLTTQERAGEIYNGVTKYDPAVDLQQVGQSINDRFTMYDNDLANADQAASHVEAEQQKAQAETVQTIQLTTATNSLMAQAETAQVDAPKVRRNLKPVIENTQAWGILVMGHFIKNLHQTASKVRVKTWEKLNVGQMAEALAKVAGETGEVFEGLKFMEVEK